MVQGLVARVVLARKLLRGPSPRRFHAHRRRGSRDPTIHFDLKSHRSIATAPIGSPPSKCAARGSSSSSTRRPSRAGRGSRLCRHGPLRWPISSGSGKRNAAHRRRRFRALATSSCTRWRIPSSGSSRSTVDTRQALYAKGSTAARIPNDGWLGSSSTRQALTRKGVSAVSSIWGVPGAFRSCSRVPYGPRRGALPDPLCADHQPDVHATINAAACHACILASETSCETFNRFLDRNVLVPTMATGTLAFFPRAAV